MEDVYLAYGDQYLLIEALPTATPSTTVHANEESFEQLVEYVKYFATNIGQKLERWKQYFQKVQEENKRVVV